LIEAEFAKAFSTGEYLLTHRLLINNKVRWVYAMAKGVRDEEGNVYKLEGFIQDITKLKEHETDMEALKNLDHLTGLPNRIILLDHLKTLLEQSHQNGKMIALMFFDLDRFKDINDSFGHDVGDELLLQMAQRLIEHLGGEHFIARLGSDEFALVMEDVHKEEYVAHVAQSVIEMLSEPYTIDELTIHSGASAGLVIAPTYAQSVQEMLQHADAALHKAKDEGRQTYRFYSEVLTNLAKQRVACENRLRRALKEGEFELYYQPQVHLKTGRVIGAEALIRWNDPDEGFVSPATFIPIAEAQGLIGHIGEWVLLTACMQGAKWHQQGHSLHLSVNISAHQIHQQNFLQVVDKVLKVSGFRPDKLTLELTESTMMDREEEIAQLLHSLRAKGIYLAIDDFGTGYSSYSYLKRFPINVLKIDKSFIDDVPYNNDDTAIVKAIVAMGKVLGFQLLAEGTEHREQLDFLEDQGCDMYQGYYKSKPLPVREFEALLQNS
jgi:diguanylate cyclase (GGDEF)-like protein